MKKKLNGCMQNAYKNKYIFLTLTVLLFVSHFMVRSKVDWPMRYMIPAFFVLIVLMFVLNFSDVKKIPRNAFYIILLIGSLNSLILPAGTGLDEQAHYANAMQIADGHFINLVDKTEFYKVSPDAAFNPEGQVDKYNLYSRDWLQLKHKKSDYSAIKEKNYNIANPVFIPSAIGIKIGRILSPYVFVSYYLGRMFNILALATMAYFAIKKSKQYAIALFGVSTIPICLWISAGYNYDSFYYGLTLLAISWLINMFDDENKIQLKDIIVYSVFSCLLVLAKAPMVSIVILPLFISKTHYQSAKIKLVSFVPIALTILLSGMWLAQSRLFSLFGYVSSTETNVDTGKVSNLTYFLAHPKDSIEVFIRTFFDVIGQSSLMQIGSPNGHLQAPFLPIDHVVLNNINIVIFIVMILITSFVVKVGLPTYFKTILLAINVFIIFATIYAIAGDSRVYSQGEPVVEGVQGRYLFITMASLPALLSTPIKKIFRIDSAANVIDMKLEEYICAVVMKLCLFGALLTTYTYFYVTGDLIF